MTVHIAARVYRLFINRSLRIIAGFYRDNTRQASQARLSMFAGDIPLDSSQLYIYTMRYARHQLQLKSRYRTTASEMYVYCAVCPASCATTTPEFRFRTTACVCINDGICKSYRQACKKEKTAAGRFFFKDFSKLIHYCMNCGPHLEATFIVCVFGRKAPKRQRPWSFTGICTSECFMNHGTNGASQYTAYASPAA